MESARAQRVAERIKEELSDIIHREIKDPRIGFVTITGVDVSNDIRFATIYISVLGSNKQRDETLAVLQKSTKFIRKELASRINLKYFPEIKFAIDQSIEAGMRIEKILRKLKKEENKQEEETYE